MASSLPPSLRNVRWLFPTGAFAAMAGVGYYFLKPEVSPLIRKVAAGTMTADEAWTKANDLDDFATMNSLRKHLKTTAETSDRAKRIRRRRNLIELDD